jgi:lipoate-protein ligase A
VTRTGLVVSTFPDPPELDTAVSYASLKEIAAGRLPDLFRIYAPARIVAFGRQDTHSPGFGEAVAACEQEGFTPVVRLAGGRAAVFHEGTLAFSWQTRTSQPKLGISRRFEFVTGVLATALRALGFEATVGEIPGEYCPGRYSIHVAGQKVIGIGQRLVDGAAHVGGVIVVDDRASVNRVLDPVYRALGLTWDPGVTGALADHRPVRSSDVSGEVIAELRRRLDLFDLALPTDLVNQAALLVPNHQPADR